MTALAIVDLGVGNLQSVLRAFEHLGAQVTVATSPAPLEQAQGIVLPGVGAFGEGMRRLHELQLVESVRRLVRDDARPLLGICLGMQLLADAGEEHGAHAGLGLIAGRVVRLPAVAGRRLPNMGWCDVDVINGRSRLFAGLPPHAPFYFAHSYALECADLGDRHAVLDYGGPITAAVERGNVFGVQFHPEKSQDAGLEVLAAFTEMAGRAS